MNSVPTLHSPENGTWDFAPQGWRQLFGNFNKQGISIEWHDFEADQPLEWEKSFHDDSLEICLNIQGSGEIRRRGNQEIHFSDRTAGFYSWSGQGLKGVRNKGEKHSFITIELSKPYLKQLFKGNTDDLAPLPRSFLSSSSSSQLCPEVRPLTSSMQDLISELRQPPVPQSASSFWYSCKAMEVMTRLFFEEKTGEELFCARHKRVAHERVDKVKALLKENMEQPLSLKVLGQHIGCSPFYLSRIFSQETGTTIPQHLRQLRIERAAELLKGGKHNVTEAAMEVGYSSLSHFTKAFHEIMKCCPGLYPLGKR